MCVCVCANYVRGKRSLYAPERRHCSEEGYILWQISCHDNKC